jgi:hypothetical protein
MDKILEKLLLANIKGPSLKNYSLPFVLRICRTMKPPTKISQSKIVFAKPYYLSITNNEVVQNSKSAPKKL